MGYRKTGLGGFIFAAAVATVLFVANSAQPRQMRAEATPSATPSTTMAADATLVALAVRFDTVDLATGISMHYAEAGPANGTPVLMLHGFTDSWRSYELVLPHLPAGYRYIMPDQRGHGDTEVPECCYRTRDLAADAVALLDELDIERAVVVGHSAGSLVGQRVAMDHPERVAGLVLIGSGARVAVPPIEELIAIVDTLPDPVPLEFARMFQIDATHVPVPPEMIDVMAAGSAQVPARVWRAVLHGLMADDPAGYLSGIRAPTLIIAGDRDAIWGPADQAVLKAAIPGAELRMYRETGHSPHWERPERFADDLTAFLESMTTVARGN